MKRTNILIYPLAIIKFVLPYLLQSGIYEPHRDEFLYLAEGHHLAWGYLEIPPVLSVFAWFTHLLGDGMFWVKFWPDLFGTLTFIFAAKAVQKIGGGAVATFLVFLPFIFGAYLRLFFLFQPNTPEVFFWTLISYSVLRYIQTKKSKFLYILGISIGLGMLSKYSVAFFTVSILLGLLLTRQRSIFGDEKLYYAGGIALLIFLPTLIWEYYHHFPVIVHMRELTRTQLQYVSPVSFLIDQLIMNLPCVFIWIAGLYFVAFTFEGRKYRSFAWAYVLVIILLLVLHGKNYYSLGVYPILFAFGAYHLESFSKHRSKAWRWTFFLIPVILGLLILPIALPVSSPENLARYYEIMHFKKSGALRWEDLKDHPLPQDFADMLGWEEMTQKAAKAYDSLSDSDKANTFVFCDNYGEAGALNYYRYKYDLPEAHSDNGTFLYWLPKNIHIDNLILVTDDTAEMQHPFVKDFKSATVIGRVTNQYAREYGSLIILFKGADDALNKMFQDKIRKKFKVYE